MPIKLKHYIEPGDWKKIIAPDMAFTDSVGPCHAIGIVGLSQKIAYLGHFAVFSDSYMDLLKKATSELGTAIRIAIVGNSAPAYNLEDSDVKEFEQTVRSFNEYRASMMITLGEFSIPPRNITVNLDPQVNRIYTMRVYPNSARIVTKADLPEEYYEY